MLDNVTRLREAELEILKEFSRICSEHSLKWYAFFGTLLGAVRCEGFLPWDDDVDVVMPAEDYRMLCLHKEWIGDAFFLQTPLDEGLPNYAKLRKNGTTAFKSGLIESLRHGGHHGISMDIIPLSDIPGTGTCCTPSLSSFKRDAVYLKNWFEPAGTASFEGLEIRIPARARKILTEVYDVWAWPSGAELCQPRHWFFDTENSWELYIKRYTGMLDDIEGKKIYLFGAADSLRIWLERFGLKDQVVCTFDNDAGKWGQRFYDVEVRDPASIPGLMDEGSRLIIVSIWHSEIGRQLEQMGVSDYYVYIDQLYDEKVGNKVVYREDLPDGQKVIPMWEG